ncbi:sigma-70 family RNA polymerase sigma factor [Pleionea sp. CnH1-48]|uniref:sigma-70 family RNA polymerase sigma factor n=1 Tax=Pleionea sp. CnH1-48 TaxID=2954494 RepID=UPI0020979804|nr:sigma-70 family RNA polymerase sigma factor [Pleionea sp. CnH1-48]MCO7222806.1 sigma-70 family RNA polymerase sigma factor [Pleionea sp. CnH1-48]
MIDSVIVMERVKQGDKQALSQLYDIYAERLFSVACSILRDREDSEDLIHDVFLEVWNKARHYDAKRGSLNSWLVMLTKSRAIDRYRALKHLRESKREPSDFSMPIVDKNMNSLLENREVSKALRKLTVSQQKMIELSYLKGLTHQEIASQCNLPVGTVKSRLSAALNGLRRLMKVMVEVKS